MRALGAISWDDVEMSIHTRRHSHSPAASFGVASVEHFLIHLQAANPVLQLLQPDDRAY